MIVGLHSRTVCAVVSESAVQRLSDNALGRVDELLDRILPLLVAAEPQGFYHEDSVADLREAARDGLVGVLHSLAGTAFDVDPLDAPRAAGRRQVQQDLPLEGVLRAYRIAGQALWEDLVEHAEPESTAGLLKGASEVWRIIDSFSSAASEAYRSEEALLRRRDDRVKASLLAALLDGRGADPQFARDAIRAFGLTSSTRLVCIVALAPEPGAPALDPSQERLFAADLASAWVSTSTGEVGLVDLGAASLNKLRRALSPCVRGRAGVSPVISQLAELPTAHRLAELAARAATPRRVAQLDDDILGALAFDGQLVSNLIWDRTIGSLAAQAGDEAPGLIDTARALIAAEGSVNAAAASTYLHRNTLHYRIKKIERLTGISLHDLSGQLQWAVALKVDLARA